MMMYRFLGGNTFYYLRWSFIYKTRYGDWSQANWEERNFIEFTYKLKLISELVI